MSRGGRAAEHRSQSAARSRQETRAKRSHSLPDEGHITRPKLDSLAGSTSLIKLGDHVEKIRGAHRCAAGSGRRANRAFRKKGRAAVRNDLTLDDDRTWLANLAKDRIIRAILHFGGKLLRIALGAAESGAGDYCRPSPVVSLRFCRRSQY